MMYRKTVALAADELDLRAPLERLERAWVDVVDLGALDLTSHRLCVLGQVFGSFSVGREELHLDRQTERARRLRVAFGVGVAWLTRTLVEGAWRREVRRRRRATTRVASAEEAA
jgi:hypothetical protein